MPLNNLNHYEQVEALLDALRSLGSAYPDGQLCFCEMRIGNPMLRGHDKACLRARAACALFGKS